MTAVPVLLLLVAIALQWIPRRLAVARWTSRAPWLAVLAWLAFGYTVTLAVATTGVTLVMRWHDAPDLLCTTWLTCLDAVTGRHGIWAQVAAFAGLVLVTVLTARLGLGAWLVSVVTRIRRGRHLEMLRLVGRTSSALGATVLPHPAPAAYVVPGRRPHMVITSGALDALDGEQTDAVLAHERAHCAGRHHLAVGAANLLSRAFSWLPAFRILEGQVRRLVELHADDLASQAHRPAALACALVAMSGAPPAPAGGLSGGGQHTVERLRRLIDPPAPLSRRIHYLALFGLTILPVTPLLVALLPIVLI